MMRIAVCGTGWMGRALGNTIAGASSRPAVVFGSRHPESSKGFEIHGDVASFEDAIRASMGIVFLALPIECHPQFAAQYGHLLAGKAVVDISNARTSKKGQQSVAQKLQALLPGAHVVKAFNSLSAYELDHKINRGVPRVVRICGDHPEAVSRVRELVLDMGMTPAVVGTLQAASELENSQYEIFPAWHVAGIITLVFFIFSFVYSLIWYLYLDLSGPRGTVETPRQLPAKIMNTIMANTAVLCLSATFLAGSVASIVQLIRWDAASAFPGWLRGWMDARKQLGLLAFLFAIMHVLLVTLQLSPDAYPTLYDLDTMTRRLSHMSNYGESVLLLGVLAFVLLLVMSVNSLPSVGATLSYMEWRLIFSWIGFLALIIVFIHELLYSLTYWNCDGCVLMSGGHPGKFGAIWPENSSGGKIPPPTIITVGVSGFTVLLRILLVLPPVGLILDHLRRNGTPRSTAKAKADKQANGKTGILPHVMARAFRSQSHSPASSENQDGTV